MRLRAGGCRSETIIETTQSFRDRIYFLIGKAGLMIKEQRDMDKYNGIMQVINKRKQFWLLH